ncbi:MAG TPA: radical SAM protein [Anaerolineaceae bacterium]|nr:radical SAM protein [Anaerolineaceae bacterium]
MKVLVISSNTLPASPSGPAYVAGALRRAGHEVEVYESLFATDLRAELTGKLKAFQPDVAGVSIRLVFGDSQDPAAPLGTRHADLRPRVKEIVDVIRQQSRALIVLGGPGFNYYARDWLNYLDLTYGIRGEGEVSFPLFLQRLSEGGGDPGQVPGLVTYKDGSYHDAPPSRVDDLDATALPAYDLFDLEQYAARGVTPAIFTKRGCAFRCTFCPYAKLEGSRYRLKSPQRVLAEIGGILPHTSARRAMIVDNSFNVPHRHAVSLLEAFSVSQMDFAWGTGDLKPVGVTPDFCRRLEDSRCFYTCLAFESASDTMLQRLGRGYTVRQVRAALDALSRSAIPFSGSVMFGAPGETPETVAETLAVVRDYNFPNGVWFTIGVYLWTGYQDIVAELIQAGQLDQRELFTGAVYLSPGLPYSYLADLVADLRAHPGYAVQVNKPSEEWMLAL